jgi:hypothetical protein
MRIAATTVFIVAVGLGPVFAKGGPPSKPAGSHPPKVAHAGGARTPKTALNHGAPKVASTHAGTTRAKGPVKITSAAATHGKSPVKTTRTSPARGKGPAKTTHAAGSHAKATSTSTTAASSTRVKSKGGSNATTLQASSTGTNATAPAGTTAVGPNVPKNPKLQAKLLAMLPPGTTLTEAAAGFRNQGQFVAAVHVSNNLGLPFSQLKTRMVDDGLSLGQAIQAVKPTANNATVAARVGEQQAAADLR